MFSVSPICLLATAQRWSTDRAARLAAQLPVATYGFAQDLLLLYASSAAASASATVRCFAFSV